MYFAIGVFFLFLCFVAETLFEDSLKHMPKFSQLCDGVQWISITLIVLSLMHFGYFNMF